MFGFMHDVLRQLVIRKYGIEVYQKILKTAKIESGTECELSKKYKDEQTYKLVNAIASVVGISTDDVWEQYGTFLIQYTMETGWNHLLRALSTDFRGFIESLDSLHYFVDTVVYKTDLKGPSFRCEEQSDGSLHLHYYSRRRNLYPIVKGVVKEAAKRLFGIDVIIKLHQRKHENDNVMLAEHVILSITQIGDDDCALSDHSLGDENLADLINASSPYPINISDFSQAFPHHFCFDRNLTVEHVGNHIRKTFPVIRRGETKLTDLLHLSHPEIPLTFESILSLQNSLFVFQLKESSLEAISRFPITLKGSMIGICDNKFLLYMCSLNVTSMKELTDRNLYISDTQRHDSTRDSIMLNQNRITQVELNRRLEETNRNLKQMANVLESAKQKTEELLCELMPASVAESLRSGNPVEAKEFSEATILFTDIVTFTNICALCSPYDVVNLLNDLYLRFDRLIGLHKVYKVETIGDCYVICGGVPTESPNHAENVLNTSMGILMESKFVLNPITHQPIRMRVGVHTGPVVAGVVGVKMPRYCCFGQTVSLANKMESSGVPGRIHVSDSTRNSALKTNQSFEFTDRGVSKIECNGVPIYTYFLEKNNNKTMWEICDRERSANQSIDGYAELHSDVLEPPVLTDKKANKVTIINGNLNDKRHEKKMGSKACTII